MSPPPTTAAQDAAQLLDKADRATRWRLLLGKGAEASLAQACGGGGAGGGAQLGGRLASLDEALGVVYEDRPPEEPEGRGAQGRGAGLGKSAPRLARWLGDIRSYFPQDVVRVIQGDAIERKGLKQLLFEPETLGQVTPSVELAATLLALKDQIPEATKETAREVVRQLAAQIVKRLQSRIEQAVKGALDRTRHSPVRSLANFDVKTTIRRNLRNWDRERRALVVDRAFFHARRHRQFEWNVVVCLDQSGSMAPSLVYGAITASILASLPALRTHLVAFDTEVVDLSDQVHDPVEVLFGLQLGGGTDIARAVGYCGGLVQEPRKTLFLLVTDLYEGGHAPTLLQRLDDMVHAGVKAVCLLALSDDGAPAFDHEMARKVRALGVPAFACTPGKIPELLEAALQGADLAPFETRAAAREE